MQILRSAFLSRFTCLGDACEDTCCKGWGMQVDEKTIACYQKEAPELLDFVTGGEAQAVMKRDPQTDYCMKFEQGWCGIQKEHGTRLLGDACHFYPRVTRSLGGSPVMTAALSCPAIVQLALLEDEAFTYMAAEADRLPSAIKDYTPTGLSQEQALSIHQAFMNAALDNSATPERILARLNSVSRSLQSIPVASWPAAVPFYLQHADARLPEAQTRAEDPFHLLNALAGLVSAAAPSDRPRLMLTLDEMQSALGAKFDPNTRLLSLSSDSLERYHRLHAYYNKECSNWMAPILRRYIAAQLALALFPFAGLGATLTERITIIAVRFATLRLALLSALTAHNTEGGLPASVPALITRVVQSLSRFLDHLADPTLSLNIYEECGWTQESRMRGLLE